MSTDFNTVFRTIADGITGLAKATLAEYLETATEAARHSLEDIKGDLEEWYEQMKRGELTAEDVEYLANARLQLLQMDKLLQKGIAKIQLDKFKQGLAGLIVSTIKSVL